MRFIINDKIVREGKLILFNIKDFSIIFNLKTKTDQRKIYEIPLPFDFKKTENDFTFNYSISKIYRNNKKIECLLKVISKNIDKKSKLYDNVLMIESD